MWKLSLSAITLGMILTALGSSPARAEDAGAAGQKLFLKLKCTQCHSIDSLKIARVKAVEGEEEEAEVDESGKKVEPPDLSGVGNEFNADFIKKWLNKEEKINGKKHKKKFKGSPEELQAISDWMATVKFNVPKKKKG
jgi:mono/diheme cytochrome c family protein